MTPERWRRVEQLFEQAAQLPAPRVKEWLERECAGDSDLVEEVRDMLAAHSDTTAVQDRIRGAASDLFDGPSQLLPTRAGPYRLTRELGRGGMGSVYLGERDDGEYLGEVAVKLIRPGLDTDFFLERFKRERQALARLNHPNIARLLDSGATREGQPYIVMELIRGVAITAFVKKAALNVSDTVRLFLAVCRAVAHAHHRFVVHRDLKPGNIMVEADGTPKLLDFGICKLIEDTPAAGAAVTATGAHMLTPDYASPEQVRGEPITAAGDIYSLGAVLFELLTGRGPHTIRQLTPMAIHKAICEEETPLPSAVAKDPALARALAGDLDTILLKALQKDPERRYPTAELLAEDLRRVLEFEPVLARPDTTWYRTAKLFRRHRTAVLAAGAVALSLAAGIIVSMNQTRIANQRLQQVRGLANEFVFNVHDSVSKLPGSLAARRLILETGTRYLDSVAATARGDSGLQIELAEAYLRIGEVQGDGSNPNLGKVPEAQASFEKARTLAGAVLAREPHNVRAGAVFVAQGRAAGRAYSITLERERSASVLTEAIGTGERLLGEFPDHMELRLALARAYQSRALIIDKGAQPDFERAIHILEHTPGSDGRVRKQLSIALTGLATYENQVGHLSNAAVHLRTAAEELTRLSKEFPADMTIASNLMLTFSHLADVKLESGDRDAAIALAGRTVEVARRIHASDASDERGIAYNGISVLEYAKLLPDLTQRVGLLEEARALLKQASDRNPAYGQFKMYWAEACGELGAALAQLRRANASHDAFTCAAELAQPQIADGQIVAVQAYINAMQGLGEQAASRGERLAAMGHARKAGDLGDPAATVYRLASATGAKLLASRALAAAGSIHAKLGEREQARTSFRRSLDLLNNIAAEPGREPGLSLRSRHAAVKSQLQLLDH